MSNIQIDFINESSLVSDLEVGHAMDAYQIQVSDHYYPQSGKDAQLNLVPKGAESAVEKPWQVVVLDNADQANALGWHDVTRMGMPIGKIFIKTAKDDGANWTVTGSHETVEMLNNPSINLTIFREDLMEIWVDENADSCEADEYAYQINGIWVSDFLFPSWAQDWWKKGETQFDYGNYITEPFQILPGGYQSYFDLRNGLGWQQRFSRAMGRAMMAQRPKAGSRRERLRLPADQWMTSTR